MLLNLELISLLTLGHLCSLGRTSFLTFWRDRDIKKAPHLCPNRWELLGAVRAGGPLRLLVQPNTTVVLQCRFCEDPEDIEDDDDIGMWTYVDIVRGSAPVRVPRSGYVPESLGNFFGFAKKTRITLTEGQGLALRKPRTTDLGLYQCQRDNDKSPIQSTIRFLVDMDISLFEEQLLQEKENKLNDENDEDEDSEDDENSTTEDTSTVKDEGSIFIIKTPNINGTSEDWPIYRKVHLDALDKFIANSNLHLEAMSEWSSWTDCSQCWSTKYGVRARRGVCVLRLPLHEVADDDVILTELAGMPALACRSAILHRLHPQISDVARKVPDFIEYDYRGCNGVCLKNSSKSHGSLLHRLVYLFRHRRDTPLITHKKLTINTGDAIVIVCPGATGETPVNWQKDGETIGGGSPKTPAHRRNAVERAITDIRQMEHWVSGQIVGIKGAPENTPFVDTTGVLRITRAAPQNSGNYECSVNGTPRGSFQVEVIVKSALSFDDLIRHFGYVSLVLLSGVMVWCGIVLCVTLRRRLQKSDYSVLPQTDNRHDRPNIPSGYDNDSSDSHPDDAKVTRAEEESTLNPAGSANKRKQKPKSDVHPARRAVKALSPGPLTASYHKVWSRFRIRPDSRRTSANDDTELVRLMLPQSPVTNEPRPSGHHCRQSSPTTSTSCDLDTSTSKRPVTIVSQQVFPTAQNVLRPAALRPVTSHQRPVTSPLRLVTNSITRANKPQHQAPSPAFTSCTWSASPISMSVLRARNSLRHAKSPSSLSTTSKQTKSVHSGYNLSTKSLRTSTSGVAKSNSRTGTRKKTKKGGKRQPKSSSARTKRPRTQGSESSHRRVRPKSKKQTLISPSPSRSQTKSPVRNRPIATSRTEISRLSSNRSLASTKRAATPVSVCQKSSVLRTEKLRPSKQASPRLSLLYKAPPSPKPGTFFSDQRDAVSCVSFLSTSANSIADPNIVIRESERSLALPVPSVDSVPQTNATVDKDATPTPQEETKLTNESSPKILSLTKQPIESEETTMQPQRSISVATFRPTFSPHHFVPPTESQQSMFQIPGIVDKPSLPQIPGIVDKSSLPQIPNFPVIPRQSSTFHRGTQLQPAEQSESLENLKLVAAFLETSAQKKSRAPKKPLSQSASIFIPATLNQCRLKFTTQRPVTTSQPLYQTSSRPEIFRQRPFTAPIRSRTSSYSQCKITDSFSMSKATSQGLLIKPTEPMQRKPVTAPKLSAPAQSKSDLQTKATSAKSPNSFQSTHVSRQLLPAFLCPCAIALSDQVPATKKYPTGGPTMATPKPDKLETVPPATSLKSTCSSKSSTSTMHASFHPLAGHQVLTPLEKNTTSFLNADSGRMVEDERVSLRMLRNTNPVKEIRLRPSRGRSTSKSKKLVAVPTLDLNKCRENNPDLSTIQETRSDVSSPGRFRAPRTETACADSVPERYKISTKSPTSNESLPHSDKLTAASTLRKNASTRYSRHKGFYVRQKPGMEKFEIVLVDTDPTAKENEKTDGERTKGFVAASRENLTSLGAKKSSKSHDSVTAFAIAHAAAVAIPQIISTNLLWSAFSPLAKSIITSQTTESSTILNKSELTQSIPSKPGGSQSNHTESQPILSGPQPIVGESLPRTHSDTTKHQPIRSKHQLIRSIPKTIRSVPQPKRSEPLVVPKTTSHRELETVRSESLHEKCRARSFKVNRPVQSTSSRTKVTISRKDLTAKSSKSICSKQSIHTLTRSSNVSLTKNVKSKYDIPVTNSETGSFANKTPQLSKSGSNQKVGSISGPLPYRRVKLTQKLLEMSSPPSLLRLPSPENHPKSPNGLKTSRSTVPSRTDLLASTSKIDNQSNIRISGSVERESIPGESRFAVDLLFQETSPACSQTTQVSNRDITVANKKSKKLIDLALSNDTNASATTRRHRILIDEATSNCSLARSYLKSRGVRLPTTEIALQVSNTDLQEESTKPTNSLPKRLFFTPIRRRMGKANPVQTTLQKHQLNNQNRMSRSSEQRAPLSPPPCNTHFETRSVNPHSLSNQAPRHSRMKSPLSESRPKTITKQSRGRSIRKAPEPSTPSRPNSRRSTMQMSPRKKSPLVKKSPQRKRQKSPGSHSRTRKTPPSTPNTKVCPLNSAFRSVQVSESVSQNMGFLLQDYDSHTIIPQTNDGNLETDKSQPREADNEPRPPRYPAKCSQKNVNDSILTKNQPGDKPQPPVSSENTQNSLKYVCSGALADAAQGVLAISTPFKSLNPVKISEIQLAKNFLVPTTNDDNSTLSNVQSFDKTVSVQSFDVSRPSTHKIRRRKSRHRKSNKQTSRSLTTVSNSVKNETAAAVKRNLSSGAERPKTASEVFVFGAQELKRSKQRLNDPVTAPNSASDIKCNIWDVPDISRPIYLNDGFTSVRGLPAKELSKRKSNQHTLNSR